jgi:hypothetical protein
VSLSIYSEPEEAIAFRILAETLIMKLDLRRECLPQLLTELHRERELGFAWLERQGRVATRSS